MTATSMRASVVLITPAPIFGMLTVVHPLTTWKFVITKVPFAMANPVPDEARAEKSKKAQPKAHKSAINHRVIAHNYYAIVEITMLRTESL